MAETYLGPEDHGIEVPELRELPVEVIRLVHAVDHLIDKWADVGPGAREDIWRRLTIAQQGVWARLDPVSV